MAQLPGEDTVLCFGCFQWVDKKEAQESGGRDYCPECYRKLPVKRKTLLYINRYRSYNVTLYRDHDEGKGVDRIVCFITDYDPKQYWGGHETIIAEGTELQKMSLDKLLQRYQQEILAAVRPLIPDFTLDS